MWRLEASDFTLLSIGRHNIQRNRGWVRAARYWLDRVNAIPAKTGRPLCASPRDRLGSNSAVRGSLFRPVMTSHLITHSFTTQPPDLRRFALITRAFLRFTAGSLCSAALLSDSCPSTRRRAPSFRPTLGRPHAVGLRLARRDQLSVGLVRQECACAGRTTKKGRNMKSSAFLNHPRTS